MNDQKVLMEFEEETPIIEVSNVIHGLFHWGGQSISGDSFVAKKDLIADIVREHKVGQERLRLRMRASLDKRGLTRTSTTDARNSQKGE